MRVSSGVLRWCAVILGGAAALCVALWYGIALGGYGRQGGKLFSFHPPIMSFALLVGMPLAMFAWAGCGVVPRFVKYVHGTCMLGVFVAVNVGIYIAYRARTEGKLPHFHSLHSWLGIAVLLCMKTMLADSVFAQLFVAWKKTGFSISRHRVAGCFTFVLAILTVLLGLSEQQMFEAEKPGMVYSVTAMLPNFLAFVVIAAAVFTVAAVAQRRREMSRAHALQAAIAYKLETETKA